MLSQEILLNTPEFLPTKKVITRENGVTSLYNCILSIFFFVFSIVIFIVPLLPQAMFHYFLYLLYLLYFIIFTGLI